MHVIISVYTTHTHTAHIQMIYMCNIHTRRPTAFQPHIVESWCLECLQSEFCWCFFNYSHAALFAGSNGQRQACMSANVAPSGLDKGQVCQVGRPLANHKPRTSSYVPWPRTSILKDPKLEPLKARAFGADSWLMTWVRGKRDPTWISLVPLRIA